MIQFPCTNLFDAKLPIFEDGEEEIFYQHPVYDIKCNQLGSLYLNEDKYYVVYSVYGIYIRVREEDGKLKFKDNIGMKQKIVWECYNSIHLTSGKQFYHVNGNILDFSHGNLVPTSYLEEKLMAPIISKKKKFIKSSVEKLLELENKYKERGIEKDELYELLMLPMWLINARKKLTTLQDKPKVKRTNHAGKASKITPEEEAEIIRLFDQGLTYGEIMLRVKFNSKSPIRRVIYKSGRDRKKV